MRSTGWMYLGVLSLVAFLSSLRTVHTRKGSSGVQLGLRKCERDAVEQEMCSNTGDPSEPVGICLPYSHPHTLANVQRGRGSGRSRSRRSSASSGGSSGGSHSRLICVPPIPCDTCFPGVMIGRWALTDVNQSSFPATASLTCPEGYSIDGNMTVQCRLNGTWEESSSSCGLAYCGNPPLISNGNWTPTGNMTTWDVAHLVCDVGYFDASCSFIVCQADGNWTDATASCSPIDCGPPPAISDGEYTVDNTTYLSIGMISCDDKFEANVTNATITCDADESWSGPLVACVRVGCETGWDEVGDSCYQISTSGQMTFDNAVAYCQGLGAELVTIETSAENNLLKTYANDNSVKNWWIGITDRDTEDTWKYHHSGDTVTFTDWKSGEPNDYGSGEDCVSMWWNNKWWNDYFCSKKQRVICEMSL